MLNVQADTRGAYAYVLVLGFRTIDKTQDHVRQRGGGHSVWMPAGLRPVDDQSAGAGLAASSGKSTWDIMASFGQKGRFDTIIVPLREERVAPLHATVCLRRPSRAPKLGHFNAACRRKQRLYIVSGAYLIQMLLCVRSNIGVTKAIDRIYCRIAVCRSLRATCRATRSLRSWSVGWKRPTYCVA